MKAVLLAGGRGRRLEPFTTTIPKPLFPLGEKPILQIIIEQLIKVGITEFIISIGYLGELIEAYFGNGLKFNCRIEYIRESTPLGTAGAISLIPKIKDDFIFMNGDILTTMNFIEAYNYHKNNNNLLTLCTYKKSVKSSLGIINIDEQSNVTSYLEKPTNEYLVSSGIYIMHPKIKNYINKNEKIDLPQLIQRLIRKDMKVKTFDITGAWFDIGTPGDLEMALKFYENKNK